MKYEGIIFDLDGTLIDTLGDLARVSNEALVARGFPAHPDEAYKNMIGMGMRNLVLKALPKDAAADENLVAACVEQIIALYRETPVLSSKAYPGIRETLSELEGKGIPMAILSNKEDGLTKLIVGKVLTEFTFRHIQGEVKGIPKKPNPESALFTARKLGLKPERIMFLGDSGSDMETAVNAGMAPFGALWGFRPREELLACGAVNFLKAPEEIRLHF